MTIGVSWFLVVPIIGLAVFAGIPPRLGPAWGRGLVASVGTVALFGSVLLHEVAHVVTAHRHGIGVERISVFLFGGYSDIDLASAGPLEDLTVSMAGPLASAATALAVTLAALAAPTTWGVRQTLGLLGVANMAVALFNLMPGYPLDGGRIVRAALVSWGMAPARAGTVAMGVGVALGGAAAALGVWLSLRGETGAVVALPLGILLLVISVAGRDRPVPDLSNEEI